MNKIHLAIYDEHKLIRQGFCSLLNDIEDMEIVMTVSEKDFLLDSLRLKHVHVLILNMYLVSIPTNNFIKAIKSVCPKINILVVSRNLTESWVIKSIKAGAKGFLTIDTDREELITAIYSLRNGYDYYSNSITQLLVNNYVSNLTSPETGRNGVHSLSDRETEILRLWGKSYSNAEIAEKLYISLRTVESHKNHIMQKLKLKTSVDLVKFGIRNNIIDI